MTRLSARERTKAELIAAIAARRIVATLVAHGCLPRRVLEDRCESETTDEYMDPINNRTEDGASSRAREMASEMLASLERKRKLRSSSESSRPASRSRK